MRSSPIRSAAWPFLVLGIPPAASHAQVREAYRAKMRELHPDKLGHALHADEAQALRDIKEAEEMLRTPLLLVQRYGLVRDAAQEAARIREQADAPCPLCSGMGTVRSLHSDVRRTCSKCHGTGWENRLDVSK